MLKNSPPTSHPLGLRLAAHIPKGRKIHEKLPQPNKSELPAVRLWRAFTQARFSVCPSGPRPCPGPKPTLSYCHHNVYGLSKALLVRVYCHTRYKPTNKIAITPNTSSRMRVRASLRSSIYIPWIPKGTATARAVSGRVRIKPPRANAEITAYSHCLLAQVESALLLSVLLSQNDSSQPRVNNTLKTSPKGWESNEPEFIRKKGEVTVNPAARSPTKPLNIRLPS